MLAHKLEPFNTWPADVVLAYMCTHTGLRQFLTTGHHDPAFLSGSTLEAWSSDDCDAMCGSKALGWELFGKVSVAVRYCKRRGSA